MEKADYKKMKQYSNLLKDENIIIVLEKMLRDYELKNIEVHNNFITIDLDSHNDDKIVLELSKENIKLRTENKKEINIKTIIEGPVINEVNYEWRPSGIIVTNVTKIYDYSIFSKKEKIPVDLISKRYAISDKKLNTLYPELDLDCMYDYNIGELYEIITCCEDDASLATLADLVNTFETHMRHSICYDGVRMASDTIYSTHTYLNQEDVSSVYDIVNGPDKLLRIYDLYNGIINERNMNDIYSIHLGLLKEDAFGLKEVKGITAMEDSIVSPSSIQKDESYYQNMAKLFSEKLDFHGKILWNNRTSLIEAVKYPMPAVEIDDVADSLNLKRLFKRLFKKQHNQKFISK